MVIIAQMDALDRNLLNTLLTASRVSAREIARTLRCSTATVLKRLRQLERDAILRRCTALVDYEKIGYDISAMIQLRVEKGKELEVSEKLSHNPHVSAIYDITGDFDTVSIAKFKNRNQLNTYVKALQHYPFISRTHTSLILNTIKEEPILIE